MLPLRWTSARGFTLIDTIAVVAIIGIVSAIAVPTMISAVDSTRLAQSAREVERELQIAKSRAVGKGRPIRIRFNCPDAGMYRITELVGTVSAPAPEDTAVDRCSDAVYPFPPDANPLTLPNLDGPVRWLTSTVTFGQVQTIEFWPDGTAHYDAGGSPWQMIPVAGITLTLTRKDVTSTITVNGLGKIRLETQ
jgi:prepilin-type N-terminal cleavage/methylation domain-containing protein